MDIPELYQHLTSIASKFEDSITYIDNNGESLFVSKRIANEYIINTILLIEKKRLSFVADYSSSESCTTCCSNLKWELIDFILTNRPDLTVSSYNSKVYIMLKKRESQWLGIINKEELDLEEYIITDRHNGQPNLSYNGSNIIVFNKKDGYICTIYTHLYLKHSRSDKSTMEYYRDEFEEVLGKYGLRVVVK